MLKEEALTIMEEESKKGVEGLRRHVEVHKINLNAASSEKIFSWVLSVRLFKKRTRKSKNQERRSMLNTRAS